ncbi:hypothetical protein ACRDNQ_17100 [Palleronia sp. KMU-117]|uniref:hypothetical protein n=1 Tax=Palleronia sp. KMU-117 TaxID=3434108 RepID=UPI003D7114FB
MVNTAGAAEWCGQTIEGRAAFGQGDREVIWGVAKQVSQSEGMIGTGAEKR